MHIVELANRSQKSSAEKRHFSKQIALMFFTRYKLYKCGFRLPKEFQFPLDVRQVQEVPGYELRFLCQSIENMLSRPFLYRDPKALMRILRYVSPSRIFSEDLKHYAKHVKQSIWKDPYLDHILLHFRWRRRNHRVGDRRLKLTFMVLDFMMQVRTEKCQDAIKGLRLLFQSIPDPYVTWKEICRFLPSRLMFLQSLMPRPMESHFLYLENFKQSCTECFPECLQVLKPRSLKHLARCMVRKCLSDAHTLPHGVWSLGLPRELEDYVLLQMRKDQFRPVIRPLSIESPLF